MRILRVIFPVIVCLHGCEVIAAGGRLEPLPDATRPVHYAISIAPDAASAKYSGNQTVRFEVLKPTRDVVLHSVGLQIESANVDGKPAARIRFDKKRERVIFRFRETLQPGSHELAVRFSGSISDDDDEGLFTRDYQAAPGVTKKPHFSMLCCLHTGRKLAPLWDQPDLKATFELELVIPPKVDAVSNMPVASRDAARVRFQPTPKMSSYLLFFAFGEMDRIQAASGATEVGVLVKRGHAEQARLALDSSVRLLEYLTDYFATPLPLPKLDSVALPGHAGFGGMENWGSILYSEKYLLAGPERTSDAELRNSFVIIAHEIAHQWFGDLVTAGTWDDLWLNEGFASWMENKATDRFHPGWNIWNQDGALPREQAMRFDAQASSYAIVPNHSFGEEITYIKSGLVLRMIEAHVGEERFRDAMRAHVKKHAFGNAVSAEVWQTIEEAAGIPVAEIGRDFTQQKGVPLIEVVSSTCAPGSDVTQVALRQARFALDAKSKAPQQWRVPVSALVAGKNVVARQVVSGAQDSRLEVPGCGPVKINAGETGYFRTRYDNASFAALAGSFRALSPPDQLGLLNDHFALAEAGYLSFDRYLDLASRVDDSSDPVVKYQLATALRSFDRYYEGLPQQARLRGVARRRLGAMLDHLGWEKRGDEAGNVGILRAQLIELLARFEDPAVIAEAKRRLWGEVPGALKEAVTRAAGAGADAAVFEDLKARAAATLDQTDQRLYIVAAAGANDPAIAKRSLEWSATPDFPKDLISAVEHAVAEKHPRLVPSLRPDARDVRLKDTVRKKRLAPVDAWLGRAFSE